MVESRSNFLLRCTGKPKTIDKLENINILGKSWWLISPKIDQENSLQLFKKCATFKIENQKCATFCQFPPYCPSVKV